MSNIEWLDTFSVLLAFIFISQNEQGSQHLRALTARMFHPQDQCSWQMLEAMGEMGKLPFI